MENKEQRIYDFLKERIEENLDDSMKQTHKKFKTKSGDVSPDDSFRYEVLVEELAKLLVKQVKGNL